MEGIPLADAVEALRQQLIEAVMAGAGSPIRLAVREVELSMEVGVTRVGAGNAGIRFWLLEFGAKGEVSNAATHRVTLKLDPVDADARPVTLGDLSKEKPA